VVTEIDLSESKLDAFPLELLKFPALKKLSLESNELGELPLSSASCASLRS
jgi:hypothetical protein